MCVHETCATEESRFDELLEPIVAEYKDKPGALNNVETYANVPAIMLKKASWYASYGTEKSKGTKVFALAGAVNNTELVEMPVGTSLGELIYDVGNGIRNNKEYKAAQIGGPSGGCIPKQHINVPLDYESLNELGAIMGSGGLIVMDEDTCMVDVARFFLEFVQDESCGKCVPCRVGIKRFLAEQEIVVKTPEIRENAANAARTAVRLGAEKVTIVYRSTREEMPAYTEEIEVAEHEGVELPLLTAPIEVVTANKKVAGITCHTMRLGEFDGSGRRRPEDAQKPVTLKADQIIAAIGQKVDTDAVFNGLTLDLTAYKTIAVSKLTGATSVPWVFAGGDVTQGPSSVVEAIAEGERAAAGIDAPVGPREKEMFFRQIPPDAQRRNVLISA